MGISVSAEQQVQPRSKSNLKITNLRSQPCKYKTGRTLRVGAFYVEKECVHIDTGVYFTLKIINKRLLNKYDSLFTQKFRTARTVSQFHTNLVTWVDYFESLNNLYIVTDLALGGDIFDQVLRKGTYYESDAADLVRVILSGIDYIHKHGVVHEDLRPENLLFRTAAKDTELLIADFGLTRIVDEYSLRQLLTTCSTGYMAPEAILNTGHGKPLDVWAIGAITYFLLCGRGPFDRDSRLEEIQAILSTNYSFEPAEHWENISSNAKDFIKRCLKAYPNKRITIQQAQAHPFISRCNQKERTTYGRGKDLLPAFKNNVNVKRETTVTSKRATTMNGPSPGREVRDAKMLEQQLLGSRKHLISGQSPNLSGGSEQNDSKLRNQDGPAGLRDLKAEPLPVSTRSLAPACGIAKWKKGLLKKWLKPSARCKSPEIEDDKEWSGGGEDLARDLGYGGAESKSITDSMSDGSATLAEIPPFAAIEGARLD